MTIKHLAAIVFLLATANCKKHKQDNYLLSNYQTSNPALKDYENEIKNSLEFLFQNKEYIDKILSHLNDSEKAEVLSIVFPEIIRWNEFRDIIETTANRALYVNGGSKLSDYSIGVFQMKPSFIEDLEMYILSHSECNTNGIHEIIINENNNKKKREIRIHRLENFVWQLKYAYAFWIVANDRFKTIQFESQSNKIRFFSTAYNTGFLKKIKTIESWKDKKQFPFGQNKNVKAQAFADFSIEFLNSYPLYFNN